MSWTGPGFVDAHSHALLNAGGATIDYGPLSSYHRSLAERDAMSSDQPWTTPYDWDDARLRIAEALSKSVSDGLVAITEMGMDNWQMFDVLKDIRYREGLALKVELFVLSGLADSVGPTGVCAKTTGDQELDIAGVKFYADGWLGCRTAALQTPYADDPANNGVLFADSETLVRRAEPYAEAGLTLATHAIGDRAISEVLDAYETIYATPTECRANAPRVEHVQVVDNELVSRMAEWGVVACVQPSFGVDDAHFSFDALGEERMSRSYDWSRLLEHGVRTITGSDYPIADARPLVGLQQLATGCALDSSTQVAPRVGVEQALALMTNASLGTVTLSANPIEIEPNSIASLQVLETLPMR